MTTESDHRELRADLLIGRVLRDRSGQKVGRIEEIRTEKRGHDEVVVEYVTGARGTVERLSAVGTLFHVLTALGLGKGSHGIVVPWNKVDLRDPAHPRTT